MKKFIISRDDLDDLLSTLWEQCQGKGTFRVLPDKDMIEVYKYIVAESQGSRLVAEIEIADVNDVYDVKDLLFKE